MHARVTLKEEMKWVLCLHGQISLLFQHINQTSEIDIMKCAMISITFQAEANGIDTYSKLLGAELNTHLNTNKGIKAVFIQAISI